jgi:hypothetical protein
MSSAADTPAILRDREVRVMLRSGSDALDIKELAL